MTPFSRNENSQEDGRSLKLQQEPFVGLICWQLYAFQVLLRGPWNLGLRRMFVLAVKASHPRFISRSISRSLSRFLIFSRLSYFFWPFAKANSSLILCF